MARVRDSAAEYARRLDIARDRLGPDASQRDVTALARGRPTSVGVTSSSLRDLERNPTDRPVTVIAYTDKNGNGHVVQVTHDAKGRAKVRDLRVPRDRLDDLTADIYDRMDDLDVEYY